jgi:hypothetical protein
MVSGYINPSKPCYASPFPVALQAPALRRTKIKNGKGQCLTKPFRSKRCAGLFLRVGFCDLVACCGGGDDNENQFISDP